MEETELTFVFVIQELPKAFLLFFLSFLSGFFITGCFSLINPTVMERFILLFGQLLTFKTLKNGNSITIIINNFIALILSIIITLIILYSITSKEIKNKGRFRKILEADRRLLPLVVLYIVPIGISVVNGFFMGVTTYFIFNKYNAHAVLTVFLPHGTFEIIALLLASSLAFAFAKIIIPQLKERKNIPLYISRLITSPVTIMYLLTIIGLIIFSGLMEGMLISLLT